MILKNHICILFLHHNTTDVTINNFNLISKYNPTKNIYPVGFAGNDLIDRSHIVKRSKDIWPSNEFLYKKIKNKPLDWCEVDILIYDFFIHYPRLPIYFVLEWDTYCNCSLEEFYGNNLKLSNFANRIVTNEKLDDWVWYQHLSNDQKKINNIGGMYPTTCMMFSNKLLTSMVNNVRLTPRIYDNMFSELRLGTLVQHSGYTLNEICDENISYSEYEGDLNKIGYYHSVKKLIR